MFISQTAEYAMRAMTVVAFAEDALSSATIAEQGSIPAPYLSKLLRRLVIAGLLTAKRGAGGGFRLARPATQIYFSEIFEAVDAMPSVHHCAFGWPDCSSDKPCPLHDAYQIARSNFITWAESTALDRGYVGGLTP